MFQGSLEHKGKAALRLYCCWVFFQLKQKYFAQRVKRQSAAENLECEETRECSMNGNTGHGRWTYHHTARHKSGSNVPLFFFFFFLCDVFCQFFSEAGSRHKGLDPEVKQLDSLAVMKLPGSQVHPLFYIAVSQQSHRQKWRRNKPRGKSFTGFSLSLLFGDCQCLTLVVGCIPLNYCQLL